jgi:protein-tyrosine phosphatase
MVMRSPIYWIDGPLAGRLAILSRPRGGDWLADEVDGWRAAGIDVTVSLLTQDEIVELELEREAAACKAQGIAFIEFPVSDRQTPMNREAYAELVRRLQTSLVAGRAVGVHCRQGVGRSSLLASSLLAMNGMDVDAAFERIAVARGCTVPDTADQRDWVNRFVRTLPTLGRC